ncbi:hypothetical protein Q9966_016748, partial [Columba livia]
RRGVRQSCCPSSSPSAGSSCWGVSLFVSWKLCWLPWRHKGAPGSAPPPQRPPPNLSGGGGAFWGPPERGWGGRRGGGTRSAPRAVLFWIWGRVLRGGGLGGPAPPPPPRRPPLPQGRGTPQVAPVGPPRYRGGTRRGGALSSATSQQHVGALGSSPPVSEDKPDPPPSAPGLGQIQPELYGDGGRGPRGRADLRPPGGGAALRLRLPAAAGSSPACGGNCRPRIPTGSATPTLRSTCCPSARRSARLRCTGAP